jgi:hypothetical protein
LPPRFALSRERCPTSSKAPSAVESLFTIVPPEKEL